MKKIRKRKKTFVWYPREHMKKDSLYHARKNPKQKSLRRYACRKRKVVSNNKKT